MTETPNQFDMLHNEIYIRYDTLSKRLKQVARYVLDNPDSVALDTIATIANHAEVPPSTLIRFANAFSFNGFNEMKQIFRQHMLEGTPNYTERAKLFRQSSESEGGRRPETPSEILKVFTMVNSQALQGLPSQINESLLSRAIDLLKDAQSIYIIGLGRSFSVACYLTYALRHTDRKTFLIDGLGGMFNEHLRMVGAKDVVISISFYPYAKETLELVDLGAKNGAKQIAITDSQVSPLAAFSEVSFVIREAQVDGFRSQVASMCLAQTLAVSLALSNSEEEAK
ncbi:MurR/RpiR family transcriptional regulator [Martelella alba]|uniref:MurR/RpiR family transcriptional regulator n=1 Tax=Martelella alba TaxID=2590451 RepID=A0ABY2SE86_9HYPH|nr:MurR/RpiR family transcriptional regulator [Martelella alba]TKI03060.1 MurR/RpiR family transcriptional regulator [Martelella alba]